MGGGQGQDRALHPREQPEVGVLEPARVGSVEIQLAVMLLIVFGQFRPMVVKPGEHVIHGPISGAMPVMVI